MDNVWKEMAEAKGHTAHILPQTTLTNISNLNEYDLLIISSGLIDIPLASQETVRQFLESGRNAYIQSEFDINHPGNSTFSYIVNNLGGDFDWLGAEEGSIGPMNVLSPINTTPNIVNSLDYYWYGTYGTGDATIQPILEQDGLHWGFVFYPTNSDHGMALTTSDQDWIRISASSALLENIYDFLTNEQVASLPTVSIEMTSAVNCPGETYQFTASIDGNAASVNLQWQINGTPVVGATANVFETINLTEGDVVECVLSLSDNATYQHVSNPLMIDEIFLLQEPEIEVVADQNSYCENANMTFTVLSDNTQEATNLSYQWTINGQAVANATAISFTTNGLTGFDDVSCILTYDNNCTTANQVAASAISVTIENALTPTININTNTTNICQGTNVTFSAGGIHWGDNPTFEWQIDGQTVGNNATSFSTTELLDGQVVTCILTSSIDCATNNVINAQASAVSVTPIAEPSIIITADASEICTGTPVTFSAQGNNWGDTPQLKWMIDGLAIANANGTSFTTSDLTNGQTVTCSVLSNIACSTGNEVHSSSIAIQVNDGALPTVTIEADNNQVCAGTNIIFTATGTFLGTQPTFQWFVDGLEVGNNSAVFSSNTLTNGQVISCEVNSSADCVQTTLATSNQILSQIGSMTLAIVELESETCLLANGMVEVNPIGGIAPYQFAWNHGASESYLSDLQGGTYNLIVTDATGCTANLAVEIPSEEQPSIDVLEIVQPVCSNDRGAASVRMNNTSRAYTFLWLDRHNFVISKEASVDRLTEGTYTLNVTDEFGCSTQQVFEIRPESTFEVQTGEDYEVVLGERTRLNAAVNINADVQYEWFPSEGLSCTDCEKPLLTPTQTTIYEVIVTNEFGCTTSSKVKVTVIPNDSFYVPNAFSPNGDGVNDYFTAFGGSNVAQINNLKIVDRWGSVLFDGSNLPVNNESEGWNGVANGKVLKTGVYLYVMEVQFTDGKREVVQGDLTLIQ